MPRAQRLAIVGASVRAAAESAVRASMEVVAADLFADADLCAVCEATRIERYPEELADWLARQKVDGWFYTGALENYPDLVDRMADLAPLIGNRGEALRRVRDPFVLQQILSDTDLDFPKTTKLSFAELDGNWLAKTYRHSNGAGVWNLMAPPDLERAQEANAYAQLKVLGKPMSAVYAISSIAAGLLGVTEQLVGEREVHAPEWGYCGSIGPVEISSVVLQKLRQLGSVLQNEMKLCGLVGVDLLVEGDQVVVIEINPRYTASMEVLEYSYGRSIVSEHQACFSDGAHSEWKKEKTTRAAKLVLYARKEVTISEGFNQWALEMQSCGHMADIPRSGELIQAGEPVTSLLWNDLASEDWNASRSNRLTEAEQRLYGT